MTALLIFIWTSGYLFTMGTALGLASDSKAIPPKQGVLVLSIVALFIWPVLLGYFKSS